MGLYPVNLNEYVASMGIPRGPLSKAYLVDTVNGSDDNIGTNWRAPLKTLAAAEDLCVGDRHDTVLFLSGDTADNPTAAIVWDKDYTHLIGLSSGVYGLGQRCRVVAQAAADLSSVITFSGNGCIIKNVQFYNEHATGTAEGTVLVTGSRNYFENVFFMTPVSATAASFSLKMSGSENVFKRCTIGQYTNARSAASYGLWLHGATAVSRNIFDECRFLSWGATHSHCPVYIDADIVTVPWLTEFRNCLFANNAGGGDTLQGAIIDASTAVGHQVLLTGKNDFAGMDTVGTTLTYIFNAEQGTTASGLLMVAVAES